MKIGQGVGGLFCATFSKQSPVNLNLGQVGGSNAAGYPLIINGIQNNNQMLITNFKVNFRLSGVSVPPIENAYVTTNLTASTLNYPNLLTSNTELASYTATNPTLAMCTIAAWAIIMVRQEGTQTPSYLTPQAQFSFDMLYTQLTQQVVPSNANITNKSNIIVYMDYTVLYGHQTWRDFQIGFQDSQYPGSIRFNPGDWLQLITFGGNNFDIPSYSTSGIWARLCGVVSYEILPQNDNKSGELSINAEGSLYKLFERV